MTDFFKPFVIIALCVIVLISLLYGLSAYFLVGGFQQIEAQETQQNVERAVDAVSARLEYLEDKSGDWALWDDTYKFMEDGNSEFIQSNLTDESLRSLRVNLILLVRQSGDLAASWSYDFENERPAAIPNSFQHRGAADLMSLPGDQDGVRAGILLLTEGPFMVVARPILTSEAKGPAHGMLIMGQLISSPVVAQLSDTTHLDLSISPLRTADLPSDFLEARASLNEPGQVYQHPVDDQFMAGYTVLSDLYGQPALLMRVVTRRPVHAQSQATMNYFLRVLVTVGLFTGSLALIFSARLIRSWQARRASEERYSLAVRGSNDGLWDWNLNSGQVYYSPRWKSLLGYEPEEISSDVDEWLNRIHPDDRLRIDSEIAQHLVGVTSDFHSEFRMKHKAGHSVWMLCRGLAVRNREGLTERMAGSLADITSRKNAEEQLIHDAFHDSLTRLPNRALFMDRLEHAIERAKRSARHSYAVIYLDLDRFKNVNDTFGHPVGDQLLIACAQRIRLLARSLDTVARLGGDEFVILVEDIETLEDCTRLAERLLGELGLPFDICGHQIFTTASLGIVLGNINYLQPAQILRDADIALYRAKENGRAQYKVFNPIMRDNAVASLELERDLRAAIEHHEFQLYYQPILSVADEQIRSLEALIRWHHPERGLIPPAEFIPIAEDTGLIVPLGEWVLGEACRQLREWLDHFPALSSLGISVNLSVQQFRQPGLPDLVARLLAENKLRVENLHLEITESVIMQDVSAGAAMLARFHEMGIDVQIDDFGTGYSSLSYLQQFPVNTLKIDRSFISRLGLEGSANGNGNEIVQTILALARQLGLQVVAEGVETADQLAGLRAMNCQFAQGYHFSKPIPGDKIAQLLAKSGISMSGAGSINERTKPLLVPNS